MHSNRNQADLFHKQQTAYQNSPNIQSTSTAVSYVSQQPEPSTVDTKSKVVVIGDGGVGKSCLLMVYVSNEFPRGYVPTVFENYTTHITYANDKVAQMALWDTAGQEDYDRLRPLAYPETSVMIICFAINYPTSLENVEDKWFPEANHFCPDIPKILVGTKIDLREDSVTCGLLAAQGVQPLSYERGYSVANKWGAHYMEVSAIRREGVEEVFNLALHLTLEGQQSSLPSRARSKKLKCVVL